MRYAILKEDKTVENFVEAEPDHAAAMGWVFVPDNVDLGFSMDFDCKYIDGKWIPPDEIPRNIEAEWNKVREIRNRLLMESDLYLLPDRWAKMSVEKQNAWLEYRQTLRDITTFFSDPKDVVWNKEDVARKHGAELNLNHLDSFVEEKFPIVFKLQKPS